jgi:4-hydroxybenzoate polyprenyltransferase
MLPRAAKHAAGRAFSHYCANRREQPSLARMRQPRHLPANADAVPWWRERLAVYWRLVRGDRPIGWLLLLWPTWWGLWLAAEGVPPAWPLLVFSAGVWLTRAGGCVINDYADRWLDPQVARTRDRPLASGQVSGREALALFAVLMLLALALVLTLNRLTVLLSGVGVFLAATYPYLKRYTYLPQVYLGLAFGWGIPMAFAALRNEVPPIAWLLYVANVLWATAYDTWYAMVDRDDDLLAGAKSTALLFGELDLAAQGVLYALTFIALALVGRQAGLGLPYWSALGVGGLLVAYQFLLARYRDRDGCFRAFRNNHWFGAAVFAGIALSYVLK